MHSKPPHLVPMTSTAQKPGVFPGCYPRSPPYIHIYTRACRPGVGSLPLGPEGCERGLYSCFSSRPPYIVAIGLPKSSPRPALARRLIWPFGILSVQVPTAHSASNCSLATSVLTPYPGASRHTVYPIPSHIVLKLFPFPALEFMEFLEIGKTLCRCLKAGLLTVYSLTKELFCTNLLRSYSGFSMSVVNVRTRNAYRALCS